MQTIKTVDALFYRELGDKIRRIRYEKNMTQLDVSKKTGYSRSLIDHWELGYSKIKPKQLDKICEALGITNIVTVDIKLGL